MRIELPYKVYFEGLHAAVTRYRNGYERKTTSRYFATKEEAIAFAGNTRRVKYAPGEAFKTVPIEPEK